MNSIFQKSGNTFAGKTCRTPSTISAICILLLVSCSRNQDVDSGESRPAGFFQERSRGEISLSLQTDRQDMTVAEELKLVLTSTVPEDVMAEFPDYHTALGDFTLKSTLADTPRLTGAGPDKRVVYRITYLLEPYLAGTYTIPSINVSYLEKQNNNSIAKLATAEIEIRVRSLLAPDSESLEIRDIKPPVALEPGRRQQIITAALVIIMVLFAAAGYYFRRKISGPRKQAAIEIPPGEAALKELEVLLAENLLDRGEIKQFHLRISDILRRYIENRFGLKAPELTTEEFLAELSRSAPAENNLLGSHKNLLADFLTQCDLVKFARHEPPIAECKKIVLICREFIEKTKETGKL